MSVGSRIRELRENKELSRAEFADKIGVTVGAISNYENEVSSPKEPILFKIMQVLECDANYLFQDSINIPAMKDSFSVIEHNLIKKYRELDAHGKDMVDTVLQKEYDHIIKLRDSASRPEGSFEVPDNITTIDVHIKKHPTTIAAHYDGGKYTEDELNEIRKFEKFAKNKKK